LLEARIEKKMRISLFEIIRRFETFAFSYVASSKVFGKTKAFAKITVATNLSTSHGEDKKKAKMAPNFNLSVFNSHF
jgi:hypothetical protein